MKHCNSPMVQSARPSPPTAAAGGKAEEAAGGGGAPAASGATPGRARRAASVTTARRKRIGVCIRKSSRLDISAYGNTTPSGGIAWRNLRSGKNGGDGVGD